MSRANTQKENQRRGKPRFEQLKESLNDLDPQYLKEAEVLGFDVENIWQLYASFAGDVERTAIAANVSTVCVLDLVQRFNWTEKLKPIIELKSSGRAGDLERGLSRAMNFVAAHRLRIVLQRLLDKLYAMDPEQLYAACKTTKTDKDGNVTSETISTKVFADLATAMEKCHSMTYAALNDTATERVKRAEKSEDGANVSALQLHQIIASAMNGSAGQSVAQLSDSQSNSDQ